MAQSIAFNAGSFALENIPGPGTERLFVFKSPSTGVFSLFNNDILNRTVINLGLLGDAGPTFRDLISFPAPRNGATTVQGLTANLQGGDDALSIGGRTVSSSVNMGDGNDAFVTGNFVQSQATGGSGNDVFSFRTEFVGSTLDAGLGNDTAYFGSVKSFFGQNPVIDMGAGDDVLVFGGAVSGESLLSRASINLGAGSDQATFLGNVSNTTLDLGGDNVQDTVRLTRGFGFWRGFQITGADTSDRLIIGTSRPSPGTDVTYQYVSGNTWQNVNNPNDRINF